jgi:acyl-CoA dehydrogenase
MPLMEIDTTLSEEEQAVRDVARRFAADVLRPVGVQLDQVPDPADVVAPASPLWDTFRKYRELQLGTVDPEMAVANPAQVARMRFLISEQLGWGDAGLAISLSVAGFHTWFAQLSGRTELIERYATPDNADIGCWAITEPDHGSDVVMAAHHSDGRFLNARTRANCTAHRDGDDYVINGQKAAWVSNGTIATVATLFCAIDTGNGAQGGGVCLVPLDAPGVSRGKPLNKLGQRALNQGEIFFDNVRIPAAHMLVGPEMYSPMVELVLALANASMGAIFVGVARAAFELALQYAKERVQGDIPIFAHQSVQSRLFKMFMNVEAARSLAWRVTLFNATNLPHVQFSIASKVFSTTTAFETASAALQIFGGNGLSREYPIEKLLRDARASMIEDGCNEVLGLIAASKL